MHNISTSKTVLTKEKYLSAMKLLKEDGLEKTTGKSNFTNRVPKFNFTSPTDLANSFKRTRRSSYVHVVFFLSAATSFFAARHAHAERFDGK